MRIGLLVNDMAALNIDERLLAGAAVQAAGDAELVALSSGCICCTIREDLVREVRALAEQQVRMRGWCYMRPGIMHHLAAPHAFAAKTTAAAAAVAVAVAVAVAPLMNAIINSKHECNNKQQQQQQQQQLPVCDAIARESKRHRCHRTSLALLPLAAASAPPPLAAI